LFRCKQAIHDSGIGTDHAPSAQRNATDSPLLRLPPEVRHIIWRFTLGGELVQLPRYCQRGQRGYAVRYEQDRSISEHGIISGRHTLRIREMSSAFCLPQVCRQIYSETAFLAFSSSTFVIDSDYLNQNTGILRLKPARRRAITSIEPQCEALDLSVTKMMHWRSKLPYAMHKPFKQTFFPNLETIVIGKLAFEYVQQMMSRERGLNLSENEWKQWLTQALKQREGEEIQVVFKDPDPSW
jgi:hypothetical protein